VDKHSRPERQYPAIRRIPNPQKGTAGSPVEMAMRAVPQVPLLAESRSNPVDKTSSTFEKNYLLRTKILSSFALSPLA
jgi:hypothetical protein